MSEPKKEPTAAEAMLFFSIVKNTRNKADVDWDTVATEQGFKNAEVAKVRFGQVKRKLGISSDPAASSSSPAKKGGAPGSNVAAGPVTPSKVTKPRGRRGGRVKKEEKREEEDEDHKDHKDLAKFVKVEQQQQQQQQQQEGAGGEDEDDGGDGEVGAQLKSEMRGARADPF